MIKTKNNQFKFNRFLNSKNSDFISHSINKINSAYNIQNRQNFSFYKFINKVYKYTFDHHQLDESLKKNSVDILLISNFLGYESIYNDLYFGKLNEIFKKKKIKSKKIYRNFSNINISSFTKKNYKNHVLGKRLNLSEEFKNLSLLFKEILNFIFTKKYNSINNQIKIFDFFSILKNLRQVNQLMKCVYKLKPKMVIFTFEGHAWERLFNYQIKSLDKNIKTVGYQFSVIKKNQIGIFRNLKKKYNPDYIATTGSITKNYLKKKIKFSEVFKLGSCKWRKNQKNSKKNIVIALDDFENLEIEMIKFCKNIENSINIKKIIVRVHPIIKNNKKRLRELKIKLQGRKKIILSNNNLQHDLKNSNYILFINSSIAYEGLFYNVIPLHFKNTIKSNLFDDNFPKELIINSNKKFEDIISKNIKFENISYLKKFKNSYFEKFNIGIVKKILKKNSSVI
tara:strand:- start:694 stop:2052 length:1359 start_codon:yes stop_codon:yes gene_type:complete